MSGTEPTDRSILTFNTASPLPVAVTFTFWFMFFVCFIWTSPEKTGSRERHVSDDTPMWSFLLCSSWWWSGFRGWSCTCRVWICQAAKCRHSDHILVLYKWSRTPLKPGTPVWWPGWGWGEGGGVWTWVCGCWEEVQWGEVLPGSIQNLQPPDAACWAIGQPVWLL